VSISLGLTVIVPTTFRPHSLTAATAAAVVQCSRTIFSYVFVNIVHGDLLAKEREINLGELGVKIFQCREKTALSVENRNIF